MLNIEKYPNNYSFLSEEDQKKIVKWFNEKQYNLIIAEKQYHKFHNTSDVSKSFRKICDEKYAEIVSVKRFLSEFNIMVEYDWPGHRGVWFLATYNEALDYEDWLFQCAE